MSSHLSASLGAGRVKALNLHPFNFTVPQDIERAEKLTHCRCHVENGKIHGDHNTSDDNS
jgi:hypothetical protein